VKHPNDDALAQLERDWPRWQIWTVPRYIGGTAWCARLRDNHQKVISSDSARHLAEELEFEVSEPVDHGWISGTSGTDEIPRLDTPMTLGLLREIHPGWAFTRTPGGIWCGERTDGSAVHFLCAEQAWELSLKIKAATGE
jgi:hypothetical protein